MLKKNLKPTLPQEEDEILEKGFRGNIADSKKFITDGHLMFLADSVPKGIKFGRPKDYFGSYAKEDGIQRTWDAAEERYQVAANFIGCGKPDAETVVAVLRDERGRCATFNPWKLKFALWITKADGLAFSSGGLYWSEMLVLLREGKVVGALMPMRWIQSSMDLYDLTSPAVPLSEV
jgi:hypothetical protein